MTAASGTPVARGLGVPWSMAVAPGATVTCGRMASGAAGAGP